MVYISLLGLPSAVSWLLTELAEQTCFFYDKIAIITLQDTIDQINLEIKLIV